ncbi:unnamed protein product [Alopecurus aequalis]
MATRKKSGASDGHPRPPPGAPDDLARTSAACVSFRRIVTDRSFVRRFRHLHAPPLLGFLDYDGFNPALPPHPSASGARALALAADFSFSFLPSHCIWTVQFTRDGRVLLNGTPEGLEIPVLEELVVCDPLHRRYILLPPVPADLTASLENLVPIVHKPWCKPFLAPLDKEVAAEGTAFRVIWMAHCQSKLSTFVFSSTTGQWRAAASKAWTDLVVGKSEPDIMSKVPPFLLKRHYAYGFFYWDWLIIKSKRLLVLDTMRMEFSMADLPPGDWETGGLAIVEAGECRLGMFGVRGGAAAGLSYIIAQNKGQSPSQWQMEKRISLDPGYKYDMEDATEWYLLFRRTSLANPLIEYFSMDIKTLQLQRVCLKQRRPMLAGIGTLIYSNFPPSLMSSRAI